MSPPLGSNMGPEDKHSPIRERIYALIVENPGICFQDIVAKMGIAFGHAQYHLYVLRKLGQITTHRVGRFVRHYAVGQRSAPEERRDAVALTPGIGALLRHIESNPGCTQRDIQRATGKARQTVYYHVKRLVRAGHVTMLPDGRLLPGDSGPPSYQKGDGGGSPTNLVEAIHA